MSLCTYARNALGLALGLLITFASSHLHAEFVQQKRFSNPDPGPQDFYGTYAAVSDDYVLVGCEAFGTAETPGGDAGQAYLYDATTGALLHEFDDPSLGTDEFFGRGVAISGNHLLIGAYPSGANRVGLVHLFDAITGQLQHTFQHPTGGVNYFPSALAIDGNYVIIGSEPGPTANVFLFDAVSGNLLHTFEPPAGSAIGGYGRYLDISGTTIVVGTDFDPMIYVYDAITGNLVDSWSDAALDGMNSIDTDGNRVLVGDVRLGGGADEGQARLYDLAGNLLQTYEDPNDKANWFGVDVEFAGPDKVLISSSPGSRGVGDVYAEALLFDATTGALLQRFDDPSPDEAFWSVSIDVNEAGDKIVFGSYSRSADQENPGHVLLFTNVPEPSSLALAVLTLVACRRRRTP